jgi:hypothetical protein
MFEETKGSSEAEVRALRFTLSLSSFHFPIVKKDDRRQLPKAAT